MGVQLRYGTAGATGGGWSGRPGALQPSFEERHHEPRWSWQQRAPKTWKDKNWWNSCWSFGCRTNGGGLIGGLDGASSIGTSLSDKDLFEPYSCDGDGTQTLNFLRGTTRDSAGAILPGCMVDAFLTSGDVIVGSVTSHAVDGTFTLGVAAGKATPLYEVAYKVGSPDVAGTSVNTLLATNVDGS